MKLNLSNLFGWTNRFYGSIKEVEGHLINSNGEVSCVVVAGHHEGSPSCREFEGVSEVVARGVKALLLNVVRISLAILWLLWSMVVEIEEVLWLSWKEEGVGDGWVLLVSCRDSLKPTRRPMIMVKNLRFR